MQSVFAVCWLSGDGPSTCSKLCFQVEAVQSMSYNWSLGHFWLCSCWFVTLERNEVITVTVQAVTVCAFHAVFLIHDVSSCFFCSWWTPERKKGHSPTCYGQLVKQSAFQVHTAKLHAVRVLEECMEACMHRLPLCRQISKHTETTEVKLLWRAHSADPPWLRGCAEKALVTTAKRWHRPWWNRARVQYCWASCKSARMWRAQFRPLPAGESSENAFKQTAANFCTVESNSAQLY